MNRRCSCWVTGLFIDHAPPRDAQRHLTLLTDCWASSYAGPTPYELFFCLTIYGVGLPGSLVVHGWRRGGVTDWRARHVVLLTGGPEACARNGGVQMDLLRLHARCCLLLCLHLYSCSTKKNGMYNMCQWLRNGKKWLHMQLRNKKCQRTKLASEIVECLK